MAGIPRHRGRLERFFSESYPYDVASAVSAFSVSVFGAYKAFGEGGPAWAGWLTFCAALVFAASITKIVFSYRNKGVAESKHELEGCLQTLHAVLATGAPPEPAHRLRITMHVPIDGGQFLEQAMEYVGDQRGGSTVGRRTPSNCGIIGRAFNSPPGEDVLVASRPSDNREEYVRELIEKYHFPEKQARAVDASSMSWMALTLRDFGGKVKGIVFCDSVDKDFFTTERQYLAMAACVGIAQFVEQKYK